MASPTVDEIYRPMDTVWVKLSSMWWPAEVQDQATLDPKVTEGLKKAPLVVVRFLKEDSYEFVKSYDHIYHYNCKKKEEFLKLGFRKYSQHKNEKNMSKYPEVIEEAERLTGGDPDIVNDPSLNPTVLQVAKGNVNRPVKKRSYPIDAKDKPSYNRSQSLGSSKRKEAKSLGFDEVDSESRIPQVVWIQKQPPPDDPSSVPVVSRNCAFCNYTTSNFDLLILHYQRYQFSSHTSVPSGVSPWSLLKLKSSKQKSERKLKDDSSTPVTKKRKKKVVRPIKESTPVKKKKVSLPEENPPVVNQQVNVDFLKDWDDEDDMDDTVQSNDEETIDRTIDPVLDASTKNSTHNLSELSMKACISSPPLTKSSSCFDFDDDEPPEPDLQAFKFGQKLPRVISPEKSKPPSTSGAATDDLKLDEFLEEVSVPQIPDLPQSKSKQAGENSSVKSNSKQNSGSSSSAPSSPKIASPNDGSASPASDDANNVSPNGDKQLINPSEENNFLAKGPLQSKKRKFSGLTEGAEDGSEIEKVEVSECCKEPSKIDVKKDAFLLSVSKERSLFNVAQKEEFFIEKRVKVENVSSGNTTPDGKQEIEEKNESAPNEAGESSEGATKSTKTSRNHSKFKATPKNKSRRNASCESPIGDAEVSKSVTTLFDEMDSSQPSESIFLSKESSEESKDSFQSERRRSMRNQRKLSSFKESSGSPSVEIRESPELSDKISKISVEKKDFLGVSKLMPNPDEKIESTSSPAEAIESLGDDSKLPRTSKRRKSKGKDSLEDTCQSDEVHHLRGNGDCIEPISEGQIIRNSLKGNEKTHVQKDDELCKASHSPLVTHTRLRSTRTSIRLSGNSTPADENCKLDESGSGKASDAIIPTSSKPKRSRLSEKPGSDDCDPKVDVNTVPPIPKPSSNSSRISRRNSKPQSEAMSRDPRNSSKKQTMVVDDVNLGETTVDVLKESSHLSDKSVVEPGEDAYELKAPVKSELELPTCQVSPEKSSIENVDLKESDSTQSMEEENSGKHSTTQSTDLKLETPSVQKTNSKTLNSSRLKSEDPPEQNIDQSKTKDSSEHHSKARNSSQNSDRSSKSISPALKEPKSSRLLAKAKDEKSKGKESKTSSPSDKSIKDTDSTGANSSQTGGTKHHLRKLPHHSDKLGGKEVVKGKSDQSESGRKKLSTKDDSKPVAQPNEGKSSLRGSSRHSEKSAPKDGNKTRSLDLSPHNEAQKSSDLSKSAGSKEGDNKCQLSDSKGLRITEKSSRSPGKTIPKDLDTSQTGNSGEDLSQKKAPVIHRFDLELMQAAESKAAKHVKDKVKSGKSTKVHASKLNARPAMNATIENSDMLVTDAKPSQTNPDLTEIGSPVLSEPKSSPLLSEGVETQPEQSELTSTPLRTSRWDSPYPMKKGEAQTPPPTHLSVTSPTKLQRSPVGTAKVEYKYGLGRKCFRSPPPEPIGAEASELMSDDPCGDLSDGQKTNSIQSDAIEQSSDDELNALQAEILSYTQADKVVSPKSSVKMMDSLDDPIERLFSENIEPSSPHKSSASKGSLSSSEQERSKNVSIGQKEENISSTMREAALLAYVLKGDDSPSENLADEGKENDARKQSTLKELATPEKSSEVDGKKTCVDVQMQPKLKEPTNLEKSIASHESQHRENNNSLLKSPSKSSCVLKTTDANLLANDFQGNETSAESTNLMSVDDNQSKDGSSEELSKKKSNVSTLSTKSPQSTSSHDESSSPDPSSVLENSASESIEEEGNKQPLFSSAPAEVKVLSSQYIGTTQSSQMCFSALDMDLDINSMPIVIEEDFLQEEGMYVTTPPTSSATIPIHPSHFNLNPTHEVPTKEPKVTVSNAIESGDCNEEADDSEDDLLQNLRVSPSCKEIEDEKMKVYEARRVRQIVIDIVDSEDPNFENYLTLPAVHLDKNKSVLNSDGISESAKVMASFSKPNNKEPNAGVLKNSGKINVIPTSRVGLASGERSHPVRTLVKKGPNLGNIKGARVVVGSVSDASTKSVVLSTSSTIVGAPCSPSIIRSDPKSRTITLSSINSKPTTLVATAANSKANVVLGKPLIIAHKPGSMSKSPVAIGALKKTSSGKIIRTSVDSVQSFKQSSQIKSNVAKLGSSESVKYVIASNAPAQSDSYVGEKILLVEHKSQTAPNLVVAPGQDILAKALAGTDLVPSDTIPDSTIDLGEIVEKSSLVGTLSGDKTVSKDSGLRTLSCSDSTVDR